MEDSRRIDQLEQKLRKLEQRLDELTRLLKRSGDADVEFAARRAQ